MRKLYLILVGLLVLGIALSGCVGKKPAEQPQQTPSQETGLEGNITVPEQGVQIEDVQSSQDENVDLGSLI